MRNRPEILEVPAPFRVERDIGITQCVDILNQEGTAVGFIKFDYVEDPFAFLYIAKIEIQPQHQNKGYASHALKWIEETLHAYGMPGFLLDGIAHWSDAKGMYERRGWSKIEFEGYATTYMYGRQSVHTDELVMEAMDRFANNSNQL
jgi:GNAT superfamily N-acetyltransferase